MPASKNRSYTRTRNARKRNPFGVMAFKRIPRKKGNLLGLKNTVTCTQMKTLKGTIKGLKFATVKDAEASVRKIKASGRSHAHKTQAAIAMEQRARAAGKIAAASVYRKFIESQKKKTRASRRSVIYESGHMSFLKSLVINSTVCHHVHMQNKHG